MLEPVTFDESDSEDLMTAQTSGLPQHVGPRGITAAEQVPQLRLRKETPTTEDDDEQEELVVTSSLTAAQARAERLARLELVDLTTSSGTSAAIDTPTGQMSGQRSAAEKGDVDDEDFAVIRFMTASQARAALNSRLETVDFTLAEDWCEEATLR